MICIGNIQYSHVRVHLMLPTLFCKGFSYTASCCDTERYCVLVISSAKVNLAKALITCPMFDDSDDVRIVIAEHTLSYTCNVSRDLLAVQRNTAFVLCICYTAPNIILYLIFTVTIFTAMPLRLLFEHRSHKTWST